MRNFYGLIRASSLLFLLAVCAQCNRLPRLSAERFSGIVLDQDTYPVVIIGGGIGGLTAGLYCGQAKVPALLLSGPKKGGALAQSHSVRNWPGVVDEPGAAIVERIRNQVVQGGTQILDETVVGVDLGKWPYEIKIASGQNTEPARTVKALTVIVATGTEPNLLGIPGESGDDGYWGKGVSNCAVCEGSLFQGKSVLVIGGGDAAITEASYLSGIADQVTILVRKDAFRAKDIRARDLVLAKPNVAVRYNTELREVIGDGQLVTGAVLFNNQTQDLQRMAIDGVFLAIGSRPNSGLFEGKLELDEHGFIVLKKHQESSIPGVFAVGDVCDGDFVQAVTAAGDGCKAALQAIKTLKDVGYEAKKKVVAPTPVPLKNNDTGKVVEIVTADDLERAVFANDGPVVIDFYATWCMPCQAMAPLIEQLAERYAGKITFAKLNIENSNLASAAILAKLQGQAVRSVPTFLFIQNGKEIGRISGRRNEATFVQALQQTFGIL
jgi:thioredoxin reductase (NADPH)